MENNQSGGETGKRKEDEVQLFCTGKNRTERFFHFKNRKYLSDGFGTGRGHMKILLIGGGGFVGGHLKKALAARQHEVLTADRAECKNRDYILDLLNRPSIDAVLEAVHPDRIIHLAAQSCVSLSWEKPAMTAEINMVGSINLLQSAAELARGSRFIFIGSSDEYGQSSFDQVLDEDSICHPCSPYALSKYSAGEMLQLLARKSKIDFVHLRPCNHFGPEQREGFVTADFASQIARIEKGEGAPVLRVGNLSSEKHFLAVEDVVSAYCAVAEAPRLNRTIYNITSDRLYSVQELLDILLRYSLCPISVETDPARFRPQEVPPLRISAQAIRQELGWKAEIKIEDALKQTLDFWRRKLGVR